MPADTRQLEVRRKFRDYLIWLFRKIDGFPKKQKYLLGERIGNAALDVSESLIRIQYAPASERKAIIPELNLRLEILRETMRVAWELKFLSDKSFLWQEANVDEVGRMAWRLAHPASTPAAVPKASSQGPTLGVS
ncbi:MAG: four helix bundle protein [Candidatus Moraniibacteriota bacterium]